MESKRVKYLKENFLSKIESSKFFEEAKQQAMSLEDFKVSSAKIESEDIFNLFLKSDPSPNQQYLEWMLIRFLDKKEGAQRLRVEDLYKAKEDLEFLFKHCNKLPKESRNIKNYKSLQELYDSISKIKGDDGFVSETQSRNLSKKEADIWLDDEDWLVLTPLTKEAAIIYGKGTRWCTSSEKSSMFDSYNNVGPLIIIINKKEKDKNTYKHQFHFERNEFMDASDKRVDEIKFLKDHPKVLSAIINNISSSKSFSIKLLFNMPISEESKKINGDLDLKKIQIEELTPGLVVNGNLTLEGAENIKKIKDLKVTGDLILKNCLSIESIEGTLEVGGVLNADNCKNLKSLPDSIYINSSCRFMDCNLNKLPDNAVIKGNMYITSNSRIKEIPENFFVESHLYAKGTSIKSIPNKHKIGKEIYL